MRTLIAITIVALMATSSAFARKHSKRTAPTTKANHGGVERHLYDVALDRKIGSICRGC
jgi:hypothetical protein